MLLERRDLHCLDHLSDRRVRRDQHRMTVFLSQVKRFHHQIRVLLNGCRGQNDGTVVAVSAAAGQLPVISLSLSDVTQTSSDTHNVNDHCRQVCRYQIGDSFLFQRKSRSCGSSERSRACRGSSQYHVDTSQLRLCLNKFSAYFFHSPG